MGAGAGGRHHAGILAVGDAMTRYTVKVFRGASFFPDRTLKTHSRGRADRRMEHLRAEGFSPKLVTIPEAR